MRKKETDDCLNPEWMGSLTDPVRDEIFSKGDKPDLDAIRSLFPAVTGIPAFDQNIIAFIHVGC